MANNVPQQLTAKRLAMLDDVAFVPCRFISIFIYHLQKVE
jgi:hypothetical protein